MQTTTQDGLVSNCCSAKVLGLDTQEEGICSECKEHCTTVDVEEDNYWGALGPDRV